jgi:hypothetical protein
MNIFEIFNIIYLAFRFYFLFILFLIIYFRFFKIYLSLILNKYNNYLEIYYNPVFKNTQTNIKRHKYFL